MVLSSFLILGNTCKPLQLQQSRNKRGGGGGGGAGAGGSCPHRPIEPEKIKSADGFVFFSLSYFDCSDLQLFAIFMPRN